MALLDVNSFEKTEGGKNRLHKQVEATYRIFEKDGRTYMQIDTFMPDGTSGRKPTNSIQIDRDCARYLAMVLLDEFDLLS